MPLEEEKIVSASSASGKIIAAGIVIAFCYWASSILVTLLVAVLLAYFLDPVVNFLEDWHVPRALGSLLVVLFTIAAVLFVAWSMIERVDQFGRDWPLYRKPLHQVASVIEQKMANFEEHVSEIEPGTTPGEHIVSVGESHPVRTALLARLSSLYEVVVAATFVPFLLFFMLAAKRQVWHATMQLFPATRRTEVKETLADVTMVLRSYVVGTALVGLILVVFSWLFFWGMGLDFPFLLGLLSGLLNLIPYLGVVLYWHFYDTHAVSFHRQQLAGSRTGRLARASKRARINCILALLRLPLGRDGPAASHSRHRRDQSNLRPHRRTATHRPLAQRLS
jgi:predicted PurR-regulated permease PerM